MYLLFKQICVQRDCTSCSREYSQEKDLSLPLASSFRFSSLPILSLAFVYLAAFRFLPLHIVSHFFSHPYIFYLNRAG
jgi:hypothetical protein